MKRKRIFRLAAFAFGVLVTLCLIAAIHWTTRADSQASEIAHSG